MRLRQSTILLILLVFAVGINYIDRGSLSVATTEVKAEFDLDDLEMGWLHSAFFWSYAVCLIGVGWMVDRFDVKWVYAAGFLLWSVATLLMGILDGFATFFFLRLLLGAGESVAYPATSRLIVTNYQEQQRGLANALVDAGSKVGPSLSMLLGGLLISVWGWRSLFLTVGVLSLLWVPFWIALVPSQQNETDEDETILTPRREVRFGDLLLRRELWGTSFGFFALGYSWYFLLSWLPAYLEEERGFSKAFMGVSAAIPLLAMAVTAVWGGWLSDRWIVRGASTTRVRKSFLIAGFFGCAVFMSAAAFVPDRRVCVLMLTLACASLGFYTSNAWAVTQTLAGPLAAGRWSGIQNSIGNMGGVVSPVLTGWIAKETGSFALAFAASSCVLLLGICCYLFLVGRIETLDWNKEELVETE